MKIIIAKIEFTPEEIEQVYNGLIERFDEEHCASSTGGQTVSFKLDEMTEVESTLNIYREYDEFDGNHQTSLISQSVLNISIHVFYDGTEVPTNIDLGERITNKFSK
jgi:hypothetical protein